MTNQEYGEDSERLLVQIRLLEFRILAIQQNRQVTDQDFLDSLKDFNVGREVLDRGFLKMFFGGGPKGINLRIRKALVNLMLRVDKEFPELKGANFEEMLKEHMRKCV